MIVRQLLGASVAVLTVIIACGNPAKTGGSTGPIDKKQVGSGATTGSGSGSAQQGSNAVVVLRDVGCPNPSCVYHAGVAAYFTCTSSGSGNCTHFGPACTPQNACMYEAASRTYKQCTKPVEGSCKAWGAACTPASTCMFDARDGYHHECSEFANGQCKKFGAFCTP